jgi:hypothetical protein
VEAAALRARRQIDSTAGMSDGPAVRTVTVGASGIGAVHGTRRGRVRGRPFGARHN